EGADGEPRFTMLESIRAYAHERLVDSEETDALRRRHAEYFVALADQIAEGASSGSPVQWPVFERELDNFRTALGWLEEARETELTVQLITSLSELWATTGRHGEGARWLEWAL